MGQGNESELAVAAATAHAVVSPVAAADDQGGSVELVIPWVRVHGCVGGCGIELNVARRRAFGCRCAGVLVAVNAGALRQSRVVWIGCCGGRGSDCRRGA